MSDTFQNTPDILVRPSTVHDAVAAAEFLKVNAHHTDFVFGRDADLVRRQASLGRILLVWNAAQTEILSMSSLYALGEKNGTIANTNCSYTWKQLKDDGTIDATGPVNAGRVVELGSVIRPKRAGKEDESKAAGVHKLIHFTLPLFMMLRFDQPFDIGVTEVFKKNQRVHDFVRGNSITSPANHKKLQPTRYRYGSPIHFPRIIEHPDLVARCAETASSDPGEAAKAKNGEPEFYSLTVSNLYKAAQTYHEIFKIGHIKDLRPATEPNTKMNMRVFADWDEFKLPGSNGTNETVSLRRLVEFILSPEHRDEFRDVRDDKNWSDARSYVGLRIGGFIGSRRSHGYANGVADNYRPASSSNGHSQTVALAAASPGN